MTVPGPPSSAPDGSSPRDVVDALEDEVVHVDDLDDDPEGEAEDESAAVPGSEEPPD